MPSYHPRIKDSEWELMHPPRPKPSKPDEEGMTISERLRDFAFNAELWWLRAKMAVTGDDGLESDEAE